MFVHSYKINRPDCEFLLKFGNKIRFIKHFTVALCFSLLANVLAPRRGVCEERTTTLHWKLTNEVFRCYELIDDNYNLKKFYSYQITYNKFLRCKYKKACLRLHLVECGGYGYRATCLIGHTAHLSSYCNNKHSLRRMSN